MINKFVSSPSRIFLVDGLGALLTAFIVGIVFTNFQDSIGMPKEINCFGVNCFGVLYLFFELLFIFET